MSTSISVPDPLGPESHGYDADGPKRIPEHAMGYITEWNPELGQPKYFLIVSMRPFAPEGDTCFPILFIIQTAFKRVHNKGQRRSLITETQETLGELSPNSK